MALEGRLFLQSETGDEGGRWSFQDRRFIEPNTSYFVCRRCNVTWDKERFVKGPSLGERCFPPFWPQGENSSEPCATDAHQFELYPKELWSRDGQHDLADGDELTIYDKQLPAAIVWSGTISLRAYPVFTEEALGYWIHADQIGVPREVWARWFIDEHPARLVVSAAKRR